MTLLELLKRIDPLRSVSNFKSSARHTIGYNNSRIILEYLKTDVELVAYGYTPGNAIIIFSTKLGLAAYSCTLAHFGLKNIYKQFMWHRIDVTEALGLIKRSSLWKGSNWSNQVTYSNKPWPVIFSTRVSIRFISHELAFTQTPVSSTAIGAERNRNISDRLYPESLKIYKLKSGKLRVEVDNKRIDPEDVAKSFDILRHNPDPYIADLPKIKYRWSSSGCIVSVKRFFSKDIEKKLYAQAVADKIKKSA